MSGAVSIASATRSEQLRFINSLSNDELRALPYLFEFWALPHQLPPEGDWKTWVALGGRGAGKTRAGAEWVRSMVEGSRPEDAGRAKRIALIGETFDQARDVMIFGESGILACTPADRRPKWIESKRRLVWPNGAEAQVFSAHDFEGLRGPQFDAAWLDELAKWPRAEEAWDMLQFALRLGDHPQQVVTTTPRNVEVLKRILARTSTVMTHAPTEANRANLAASFLEEISEAYEGTHYARQEIEGLLVDDVDGTLWPNSLIDEAREVEVEPDRVVVAVDPAVSSSSKADECGIVVVGASTPADRKAWRAVVMEDASVAGASPMEWARAAVAAFERHEADQIVVEVNQGGDLVEDVVRQIDEMVPIKKVHANRGKATRAEPVAALYEQGKIGHTAGLGQLEAQMRQMTRSGYQGRGSPDRVDALVWALTELMIKPPKVVQPKFRVLE